MGIHKAKKEKRNKINERLSHLGSSENTKQYKCQKEKNTHTPRHIILKFQKTKHKENREKSRE